MGWIKQIPPLVPSVINLIGNNKYTWVNATTGYTGALLPSFRLDRSRTNLSSVIDVSKHKRLKISGNIFLSSRNSPEGNTEQGYIGIRDENNALLATIWSYGSPWNEGATYKYYNIDYDLSQLNTTKIKIEFQSYANSPNYSDWNLTNCEISKT